MCAGLCEQYAPLCGLDPSSCESECVAELTEDVHALRLWGCRLTSAESGLCGDEADNFCATESGCGAEDSASCESFCSVLTSCGQGWMPEDFEDSGLFPINYRL